MSPAELEKLLTQIEGCCHDLALAVSQGAPEGVQASSGALHKLAVDTAHWFAAHGENASPSRAQQNRFKRVAMNLALQKEQLIRRSAMNERALQALLPATSEASYAQLAGPYGGALRQSGAFTVLKA